MTADTAGAGRWASSTSLRLGEGWRQALAAFDPGFELMAWRDGRGAGTSAEAAEIGFDDGQTAIAAARGDELGASVLPEGGLGPKITRPSRCWRPAT